MLATVVLALGLAGCGSSSSSSTSSTTSGGSSATAQSSALASSAPLMSSTEAAAKGAALGKKLGKTSVGQTVIGFLRSAEAEPIDDQIYAAFAAAAKQFGWKIDSCDGQGSSTGQITCGNTLLDEHVKYLVNDAIDQAPIASVLQRAKTLGVPTIEMTGEDIPRTLYTAVYAHNETRLSDELAQWLVNRLGSSGQQQIIAQTAPTTWGTLRLGGLQATVAKHPNLKIVATPDVDLANVVNGTATQISALLQQYPDTKVIWLAYSGSAVGAAEAVEAKYHTFTYPKAPLIIGFVDSSDADALIRQGKVAAIVSDPYQWPEWVAVDQIAENLARHTPLSTQEQPNYGPGIDFAKPSIITASNLPATGTVPPPVNYQAFFTAKWKAEFGK
jgi:ABC-type sugar transport system substrate-binding protein